MNLGVTIEPARARRGRLRRSQRSVAGMWLAGLVLVVLLVNAAAQDVNMIRGIRAEGAQIEIEIHSTSPFPVRALPPTLRIGTREFRLSRPPADGSLDTLIFLLSPEEFAGLAHGAEVSLHHGGGAGDRVWSLGRLDKSMMRPRP